MIITYRYEVREFLDSLQKPTRMKFARSLLLLETYGQNLGMPHMRSIGGGIFELRIRGQQEVRIFFIIHQDEAILLHGFIKKTQKIPKKELDVVKKRKFDLT